MSNEVIIDGCNVAECAYYAGFYKGNEYTNCYCERLVSPNCQTNDNCYFKQLQRAKADIEELKEYNDWYDKAVRELLEEKDKLQAELEQYKKSKQASYEVMQTEWNKAVNELRDVKAENDTLHITISKLKEDLSQAETSLYAWKEENEKLKAEIYDAMLHFPE